MSNRHPVSTPQPNYTRVSLECNAARNHNDVQDSWTSVSAIIGYYGDNQGYFNEHARPGYFNDPDMVTKQILAIVSIRLLDYGLLFCF